MKMDDDLKRTPNSWGDVCKEESVILDEKRKSIWDALWEGNLEEDNLEVIRWRFKKNLKMGSKLWSDRKITKKVFEDFEKLQKAGCVDEELWKFIMSLDFSWYFCAFFLWAIYGDINSAGLIAEEDKLKVNVKDLDCNLFFDAIMKSKEKNRIMDSCILGHLRYFYIAWETWFIDNFLRYFTKEEYQYTSIASKAVEELKTKEMEKYIFPKECLENLLKRSYFYGLEILFTLWVERFDDYEETIESFDFSKYIGVNSLVEWLLENEKWELLSKIVCKFPQEKRIEILESLMKYGYGESIISNINTYRWVNRQDVVEMLCKYWYKEDVKRANIKWAAIKK